VSFGSPLLLVLLVAIPLAVAGVIWLDRRRARAASAWAPAQLLPNMVARPPDFKRLLPTVFLLVGAAFLLVGFARPRASVRVSTQEATLVLVLDVSGSMAANDAQPSRIAKAKAIARQFIDELPHGYRISLVTFSDQAAVVASPQTDRTQIEAALARAKTGPQGTALAGAVQIGVKVAASVKGIAQDKRPPATIVLLSDGGQTAGSVTAKQAGTLAQKAAIPVNGVLLGTPDGVVEQKLAGGYTERIQVPAQAPSLQTISRLSGGHFQQAAQGVNTKEVYAELGSRVGKKNKTVDISSGAAAGGLAFMLVGGLLSGIWFRRIP
jgi:Ca-activated chloride channel family protein